ncbi:MULTISPECIES: nucleoid-associated protein [Stenotrophomonas]|uniref:nucleoid-associated protein n=1 Tax=Stenotrophomonas TaxID=40323 RepID=UPI0015E01B8D|nr:MULTISPECIES: nucleoid-associated protein [Stenotrophomonas]MBB1136417.1 nucleoid-associated protein [Stenotrophomonas sp. I18B00994]MCU1095142.1 nucleoid-associated protein [Stenotrophomonas maltophilia]HEI8113684.1 nucleoid-associated protein [Stenotrophomonas maltophilia]HEL4834586.1 nucleoid-associated protein [Stenotrophomonas maltophilia]HEL5614711.1 nucleoid-associated protein [Stenotrophomonas maltophilia]
MSVDSARVVKFIVHRVGNRIREEGMRLSSDAIDAGPDVDAILVDHYLRGTQEGGERYAFTHESTLDLNDVRRFAADALTDDQNFVESSRAVARHLYSKSTHPGVAGGDLFVVLFELRGGLNDGGRVLGLFKTEVTERFLVVDDATTDLSITGLSGIDPRHLQKAALVSGHDGTVVALERGKSRTRYWLEDFLKVAPIQSDQGVATFVSSIAKQASAELKDPSAQVAFKACLAAQLTPGATPSVDDLLDLGANFVGQDSIEAMAEKIEVELGYKVDRETVADVRQIRRSLNATLRSTPVSPGVDLVFSKGVTPSTIEISHPDGTDAIHIVIKLEGPR